MPQSNRQLRIGSFRTPPRPCHCVHTPKVHPLPLPSSRCQRALRVWVGRENNGVSGLQITEWKWFIETGNNASARAHSHLHTLNVPTYSGVLLHLTDRKHGRNQIGLL